MSICFTRVPIGGLGEPNIYHDLGVFYKNVGILLGSFQREKNGLADTHLYGFQSAGTAIDQPREVIQKLLYHHLMYFTRIGDFTWRMSDCEELVGVTRG